MKRDILIRLWILIGTPMLACLASGLALAQTSPKGTFKIESETKPSAPPLEGTDVADFVVSTTDPKVREPLDEHPEEDPTQYFISPDEKWIFATYHLHSHAQAGKLFKRGDGLKFHEIDAADSDEAWKFFAKKEGELEEQDFEIIDFVAWSPDSNRLLVDLRGGSRGSSGIYLWYAYFNTKTGTFELTDYLRKLNKGARDRWKNFQPKKTFGSFPEAASAEPLGELPPETESKKRFEAADRRVKESFQKLMATQEEQLRQSKRDEQTSSTQREIYQEQLQLSRHVQRRWIKTREIGAKLYADSGDKSTAARRYWQHMADSTEARASELERELEVSAVRRIIFENISNACRVRSEAIRCFEPKRIQQSLSISQGNWLSCAATDRKYSFNLFWIAAINGRRFSFVIPRADDDLQLPVPVQIERSDDFVSIRRVEAISLSYVSSWVKLALDQLRLNFACDHATQ
jgi:uncharacterized protein YecT (DUF1311 family)